MNWAMLNRRDPITGVPETEWQRDKRQRYERKTFGVADPERKIAYRIFYRNKSILVLDFPCDMEARRFVHGDELAIRVETVVAPVYETNAAGGRVQINLGVKPRVVWRHPEWVDPEVKEQAIKRSLFRAEARKLRAERLAKRIKLK